MNTLTAAMVKSAIEISKEISAKAVVFDADVFESREELDKLLHDIDHPVALLTRNRETLAVEATEKRSIISIPKVPMTRTTQIKIAVLVGVAEKMFGGGDTLVMVCGDAESGRLDLMAVVKVGDEPEFFLSDELNPLPPDVQPAVFERVLNIASELAAEGREGKSVGAIFVIGDSDNVLEHSRQLVFNPFKGYSEEERNILTGELDETLKEFAAIDGAFVIRGDGVVQAAGRYLMPKGKAAEPLRAGLGARHEAAAAITAVTDAVAISLSQSTGNITVFNSGMTMTEIDKIRGGEG